MSDISVDKASSQAPDSQRIDKWLWCARFFKTRSLASKFVASSNLRLTRNGVTVRIEKPSFAVRAEDELAFSIGDALKIVKICSCGVRRGPAPEARLLYDDHSPPPPEKKSTPDPVFMREKGSGRPTKKERRDLQRLQDGQ